jgi:DNA polymerase II small subunit
MYSSEKLRAAVEFIVSAGYQLNKDAFELLNERLKEEDPIESVRKTLKQIETLNEKPLFIDRKFLENVLQLKSKKKNTIPLSTKLQKQTTKIKTPKGRNKFQPYAKEVDKDFKIIEDPSKKLSSTGELGDFIDYFRDRFKRMEKLLRQRIDVKSATSLIEALKSPIKTKLKIICMITEKKVVNQRVFLKVEDLHATAQVLIPQNRFQTLRSKINHLILDQVICLNVHKTRNNLLIVDEIIFPEIAQKPRNKASVPIFAALTSDLHVGSTKFQDKAFNRFILWLNGKYGNKKVKEMSGHVKYVLIAGDIVDGIGIYPNQINELATEDIHDQYNIAANFIEKIPDYIEVIIIPGNHDVPRKALPQPAISNEFLDTLKKHKNIHLLGNPCYISLHKVEVLMYHGSSLEDINSTVQGMDHNNPERAMSLLLKGRHLSPMYGKKTPLSPENKDFLVIERVPDIFHAGHIHILGYSKYRGVLAINSGCWQEQTDYMTRLGLIPTPNKVPLVNLQTLETIVMPFN